MKQSCLICERSAADRNLYCQDVRCQPELSPLILDYGEMLGDLEIVKPVIVLHTAALYEARRGNERLLLKVAHPGSENTERLKREALLLQAMQQARALGDVLPQLLPPFVAPAVDARPYGKIVLGSNLLYYCLFAYSPGEPLRDLLMKTPQLWVDHVGRITIGMATAVALMQSHGRLHLSLSPESALVHFEPRARAPHVTLIDLGLACTPAEAQQVWYAACVAPAYAPPVLLRQQHAPPEYSADVYGLGLTLYEMLVGAPAIPARQRSDEEIDEAVRRGQLRDMSRSEDIEPVAQIALEAVGLQPPASAQAFADKLIIYFKQLPAPRRSRWLTLEAALLLVVVLLAVAFLIALVSSLSQGELALAGSSLARWSDRYA